MTDLNQADWAELDSSNNSAPPNGWPSTSMLPSNVEPAARAMRGAMKRWYNHANGTVTSAGTNTVTLTYAVAPTAYVTGDFYLFKAGGTNTAATTLNVNALGAKTVQRAGVALGANGIRSGFFYGVVYDGTNFQIVFSSDSLSRATFTGNPANPAGTTSTTEVMAGMGGVCKITPTTSGTVVFRMEFAGISTNLSTGGAAFRLVYSSGTAPVNGVAFAGNALGVSQAAVAGPGGMPFSLMGIATGLIIGTTYWFDVSQMAVISDTVRLERVNAIAFELN